MVLGVFFFSVLCGC